MPRFLDFFRQTDPEVVGLRDYPAQTLLRLVTEKARTSLVRYFGASLADTVARSAKYILFHKQESDFGETDGKPRRVEVLPGSEPSINTILSKAETLRLQAEIDCNESFSAETPGGSWLATSHYLGKFSVGTLRDHYKRPWAKPHTDTVDEVFTAAIRLSNHLRGDNHYCSLSISHAPCASDVCAMVIETKTGETLTITRLAICESTGEITSAQQYSSTSDGNPDIAYSKESNGDKRNLAAILELLSLENVDVNTYRINATRLFQTMAATASPKDCEIHRLGDIFPDATSNTIAGEILTEYSNIPIF